MTDGANTTEYDLDDHYYFGGHSDQDSFNFKFGQSPFWFNRENGSQELHDVPEWRMSYLETSSRWDDRFYNLNEYPSNRWRDYPDGFTSQSQYVNSPTAGPALGAGEGINYPGYVRHASWQDMFAEWVHYRINNELMGSAKSHGAISQSQYNAPDYADVAIVNGTQADTNLSQICATARQNGIVIYTVAFEAPYAGQQALKDCASSPGHYFDVDGTDITAAFTAIASNIRALKLTQ